MIQKNLSFTYFELCRLNLNTTLNPIFKNPVSFKCRLFFKCILFFLSVVHNDFLVKFTMKVFFFWCEVHNEFFFFYFFEVHNEDFFFMASRTPGFDTV